MMTLERKDFSSYPRLLPRRRRSSTIGEVATMDLDQTQSKPTIPLGSETLTPLISSKAWDVTCVSEPKQ